MGRGGAATSEALAGEARTVRPGKGLHLSRETGGPQTEDVADKKKTEGGREQLQAKSPLRNLSQVRGGWQAREARIPPERSQGTSAARGSRPARWGPLRARLRFPRHGRPLIEAARRVAMERAIQPGRPSAVRSREQCALLAPQKRRITARREGNGLAAAVRGGSQAPFDGPLPFPSDEIPGDPRERDPLSPEEGRLQSACHSTPPRPHPTPAQDGSVASHSRRGTSGQALRSDGHDPSEEGTTGFQGEGATPSSRPARSQGWKGSGTAFGRGWPLAAILARQQRRQLHPAGIASLPGTPVAAQGFAVPFVPSLRSLLAAAGQTSSAGLGLA